MKRKSRQKKCDLCSCIIDAIEKEHWLKGRWIDGKKWVRVCRDCYKRRQNEHHKSTIMVRR